MKIFRNIYIAFIVLILSIGIFSVSIYHYCLKGTSNNTTTEKITIPAGTISSIAKNLKEQDYIRSELAFKLYIRLTKKSNLKAGDYLLSKDMGVIKIIDILEKGSNIDHNNVQILFKEGLNMRQIAEIIEKNTNNTKEMVFELLEDEEYLNTLIDTYWFLEKDILNENIYYPLEGYLYPNTYYFSSNDLSIKTIFKSMLDEMENKLKDYKETIISSSYSVHELITMASIVEAEGISVTDRNKIAGVFYNRLDKKMNLGSDVTTYYGAKINMGDRDLTSKELSECNNYNTRCSTFKTLPVSPICNPSINSIISSLTPEANNYYYFVADKNGKVYFSKTLKEHNNTIAKLKKQGLWYVYD